MDTINDVAIETLDTPERPVYDDTEVLKVSAHSRPSAVAGAIAAVIRNQGRADVQAIGAGATNQAIKAVAIARSYLSEEGVDIVCTPSFIDVSIDDEERTAIGADYYVSSLQQAVKRCLEAACEACETDQAPTPDRTPAPENRALAPAVGPERVAAE